MIWSLTFWWNGYDRCIQYLSILLRSILKVKKEECKKHCHGRMPSHHYQDPLANAVAMALLSTLLLPPLLRCHFCCAPHWNGEKQFEHTPSSRTPYHTEINQIKNNPRSKTIPLNPYRPHENLCSENLVGKTLASRKKSADSHLPTGCKNILNKRNLLSSSNSLWPAPSFLCQRTAPPIPFSRLALFIVFGFSLVGAEWSETGELQ